MRRAIRILHDAAFHVHLAAAPTQLGTALRQDLRVFALLLIVLLCEWEAGPNGRFLATAFLAHFATAALTDYAGKQFQF